MNTQRTDNRSTPIEERQQHIAHAKLLLYAGCSQRQVANQLGYAPKTINEWALKFGWRDKLSTIRKGKYRPALKVSDSLSTFMMYLKKKDPELYNTIQPVYKNYIRK